MIVPIVQAGLEVLRRRAQPVEPAAIATPQFKALLEQMFATMRAAPGVGLAAPQIGLPLRLFVVEDSAELMAGLSPEELAARERVPVPPRVFVNPTLRPIGSEQVTFFEGCLSVAGYAALVTRHREVEVTALDEHGQSFTWQARGWPARILQHEFDHLEGMLYVDRMNPRSFGLGQYLQARFAGKGTEEVLEALKP